MANKCRYIVGVPNKQAGTDVTVFFFKPAWICFNVDFYSDLVKSYNPK